MINFLRNYESGKPKRHAIGMTVPYPGSNTDVLSSPADWVSMNGDLASPPSADGAKVSLSDTDHLCGICGNASWVWKSVTQGHNVLLMDGYDNSRGVSDPAYNPDDPKWEATRRNMGYARSYMMRMDLARARPRGDLASSGFCLAVVGSEYLVFLPAGRQAIVDLAGTAGSRTVEWFNPSDGQTGAAETVAGGGKVTITAPFSGIAVAYIHN
jgi:collagenase-like protein with putative collagen-binding domain